MKRFLCGALWCRFLNAAGQCTKFTHFRLLVKLPLDSFFVLNSCIFNYLSFELVWQNACMLNMDVDSVWHIDVFHWFFFHFSDPLAKVDIIYARKIQWYFNIFRLEFQLKLQSKWESRKFPRQSAFFLAKKCRMHISFHSTSFLLLFRNCFFFVALKFMFEYFLNHTVSSGYFLVTSNIHRCCFFPSSWNISALIFFENITAHIFYQLW